MIVYNPLDGQHTHHPIKTRPRHCFLMTQLGEPVPPMVQQMREAIEDVCSSADYEVIDAQAIVSGRDYLLEIWHLIASCPLSVGVLHEEMPQKTQGNILYEFGVAQALGKETVIVKGPKAEVPTDLIRSGYILFDNTFRRQFRSFMTGLVERSEFYVTLADQTERNPLIALDYLKRAYLLTGEKRLKEAAGRIADEADIKDRAENSVEMMAANF